VQDMEFDQLTASTLNLSQLNQQVYELLREQILTGALTPGQRLSIGAIAKHLDISVTPVRDALRRLSADGLVTMLPRRGTFVAEFTQRTVRETFHARRIIEGASAEKLDGVSDQTVRRMEEIVDMQDSLRDGTGFTDYETHIALDTEFHRHIVDLLGNERIAKFYVELRWPMQITRGLYYTDSLRADRTVAEHRAVVEAMKKKDVNELKRAILDHLDNAEANLLQHMPTKDE
jgi:DNA-binding GntR family transcriptional regulator